MLLVCLSACAITMCSFPCVSVRSSSNSMCGGRGMMLWHIGPGARQDSLALGFCAVITCENTQPIHSRCTNVHQEYDYGLTIKSLTMSLVWCTLYTVVTTSGRALTDLSRNCRLSANCTELFQSRDERKDPELLETQPVYLRLVHSNRPSVNY